MSQEHGATGCECEQPGYCPRHACWKTDQLQRLCRRDRRCFQLWEEGCGPGQAAPPQDGHVRPNAVPPAPVRHLPVARKPWEGVASTKPWEFPVQIVIPHLDSPELVETALPLWRLQTVRPFICIVDTGSAATHLERLYRLEAEDVEVHLLRLRGFRHPSSSVAMALDVAAAVNLQEFQFHTHTDVFPRRRDLLECLISICSAERPVVGYEISPRDHVRGQLAQLWPGMVGHTCLMLHVPTIRRHGIHWHLEQSYERFRLSREPQGNTDTEVAFNLRLRELGIVPHLIGHDENGLRQVNDDYDHFRSFASSGLYAPQYHGRCTEWANAAMADARARAAAWTKESSRPV